jgi:hypothetical protein
MFRKLILAAAATAALGLTAVTVTPTTASAHGWHGGHGHGHGHWHGHGRRFGIGFYPAYYGGYGGGCFYVKKFVPTPYGVMPKRVLVCS